MEKRKKASVIAFGGILAALAVVIMCMGTLIPVATFACPVLCILLDELVRQRCGGRTALAWYGAVGVLSCLLAPDKEAAAVFMALGYYPVLKPTIDSMPLKWLWKGILFNAVILALYWLMIHLFGMEQMIQEFTQMGAVMTAITLALVNVCFILVDRLLGVRIRFRR